MTDKYEPLVRKLKFLIHWAVRGLAILMVIVIMFGTIDVAWTLYEKLAEPPIFILTLPEMLATFGAFMAVLIAIEIFINITVYLRDDVIHVKIVMATALMAIARKVIILDLEAVGPQILWGLALLMVAVSVGYWLVHNLPRFDYELGPWRFTSKEVVEDQHGTIRPAPEPSRPAPSEGG